MELSIASHGSINPPILEESKKEVRKNDRNTKINLKDPMTVNTTEVKVLRRGANANEKWLEGWQKNEVHHLTFNKRKQKVYPFPDEDVPNILEQLLQIPSHHWPPNLKMIHLQRTNHEACQRKQD